MEDAKKLLLDTVKLQEITVDDVVKADLAKRLMYKRTTLLSVGEKIIPVRNMPEFAEKWYFPDLETVKGEFPVPEGAVAALSPSVEWAEFGIKVEIAEFRFMITDLAKARGQDNWQYEAMVKAGSSWFANCVDKQILDTLYAGAGITHTITTPWDEPAADPEGDIMTAYGKLLDQSNIGLEEIKSVCIVYPAKVDHVLRALKMIGNIQTSLMDYMTNSFGFMFYPTRYYDEVGTTKLQDDGLIVVNSEETGVHLKYTGGAIPLAENHRIIGRGQEYIVKQIFGTKVIPHSKTVTTSKRIVKLDNVI